MIKVLFVQLYALILYPSKEWTRLSGVMHLSGKDKSKENEFFFRSYLYPIIGIVGLLAFIGVLLNHKNFEVAEALRRTIYFTVEIFAGFYLAVFVLTEVMARYFSREKNFKLIERFVGYGSVCIYFLNMVFAIFPDLSDFFGLFTLYTIYIVWEGVTPYLEIPEEQRVKFTTIASAILLLSPFIVGRIMFLTMPGMRI